MVNLNWDLKLAPQASQVARFKGPVFLSLKTSSVSCSVRYSDFLRPDSYNKLGQFLQSSNPRTKLKGSNSRNNPNPSSNPTYEPSSSSSPSSAYSTTRKLAALARLTRLLNYQQIPCYYHCGKPKWRHVCACTASYAALPSHVDCGIYNTSTDIDGNSLPSVFRKETKVSYPRYVPLFVAKNVKWIQKFRLVIRTRVLGLCMTPNQSNADLRVYRSSRNNSKVADMFVSDYIIF